MVQVPPAALLLVVEDAYLFFLGENVADSVVEGPLDNAWGMFAAFNCLLASCIAYDYIPVEGNLLDGGSDRIVFITPYPGAEADILLIEEEP